MPRHPKWGLVEYAVSFVYYMLFFGIIAGLLRSRFPLELGLFFYFTNDALIERVLRRIGILLVPDSLGATFVEAFVWLTGASILFARWKDSAPAWLSSWFSPSATWSYIAGSALGCVVLVAVSKALVNKVLPWMGIEIARDSRAWALTYGLVSLAVLGLLLSMPAVLNWLGSH